ncbi:hypothetical protein [Nonomuraea salmonea]|uniref:hypothetical protein n=1 Tax=Nonomuraea salmonea TaxID=46181 RepID=UPI002FEC8438
MSYSGVKLPEFDTLVARHTAAATQMEELAARLYQELTGAGLDTTPAERIRKLAAQVGQEAEDLRKRQRIVREMERHKIAFGASIATGSIITVPDSLAEAQGLLDGTLAAKAAKAAAAGDKNALKQLQAYAAKTRDPSFAKTFLRQLGAKGGSRSCQPRSPLNCVPTPQQEVPAPRRGKPKERCDYSQRLCPRAPTQTIPRTWAMPSSMIW